MQEKSDKAISELRSLDPPLERSTKKGQALGFAMRSQVFMLNTFCECIRDDINEFLDRDPKAAGVWLSGLSDGVFGAIHKPVCAVLPRARASSLSTGTCAMRLLPRV